MFLLTAVSRRIFYQVGRSCSCGLGLTVLFIIIVITSLNGRTVDIFEYTESPAEGHRKIFFTTICTTGLMQDESEVMVDVTNAIEKFKATATEKCELVIFIESLQVKLYVDAHHSSTGGLVAVRTKSIGEELSSELLSKEVDMVAMMCIATDQALSEIAVKKEIVYMDPEKFLSKQT